MTVQPYAASYTATETRGIYAPPARTSYTAPLLPANIRLVQTTATGSIDILKILTALAHGAEGVMVAWTGRATPNHKQRLIVLRELLHFVGCQRERLAIVEGAPDEGARACLRGAGADAGSLGFRHANPFSGRRTLCLRTLSRLMRRPRPAARCRTRRPICSGAAPWTVCWRGGRGRTRYSP